MVVTTFRNLHEPTRTYRSLAPTLYTNVAAQLAGRLGLILLKDKKMSEFIDVVIMVTGAAMLAAGYILFVIVAFSF